MSHNGQYKCRSCEARNLSPLLSLGRTPLANALVSKDDLQRPVLRYPLHLALCANCSLVQILETVPPEDLFCEYLYFSSFSDVFLKHAREVTKKLIADRGLGHESLVVEIASNDGYLLQYFKEKEIPVLGIEPAGNIATVAREEKGIRTLCEFFSRDLAQKLVQSGRRADVVIANNVLAHVPDLNGFMSGISLLLKEDGVAWIEVPYLLDMINHGEFDTIYHEHIFYFSVTALKHLFGRHGLVIDAVEWMPLHGGSLALLLSKGQLEGRSESARRFIKQEEEWGVTSPLSYQGFSKGVFDLKEELTSLLHKLGSDGKRVAAYGAAAKGTMLLNVFDIGRELVEFVVDRSPYKQGLYVPGTGQPILAPSVLLAEKPDYLLVLAWNFAEEIMAQQQDYVRAGGRFIIPIPKLRVV